MGEDVGVGVAVETALVRDLDAPQDQRRPDGEAVRVDPEPGPCHPSGSIRRARFSNTAISFTPHSSSSLTASS